MANREKGEIPVSIDGVSYTFCFNHAAMIAAEDAVSTPDKEVTWDEFIKRVQRGSARAFAVFIWAGLQKFHPTLTVTNAAEIIDAAGGAEGLGAVLQGGVRAATADPRDAKALGVARPRKAQTSDGTGETATSPVAVLV